MDTKGEINGTPIGTFANAERGEVSKKGSMHDQSIPF